MYMYSVQFCFNLIKYENLKKYLHSHNLPDLIFKGDKTYLIKQAEASAVAH